MGIEKVQTAGRRLSLLMKGLMVVLVTSAVVQALLIGCLLRTFTEYGLFSAAERVVRLLLWAMICRRAAELFQTAGQGEPFVSKNVGRLRRIALCFVGMGFLPGLAGKLAVLGALDKPLLSIDSFLWAALIYGLSEIFRYGCALQKLDEETL